MMRTSLPASPRRSWLSSNPARGVAVAALAAGLGGCVSPPPRVNQDAEARVAHDPQALGRIGAAAAASGDDATAAAFYGRALQLDPSDASAALGDANSLLRQGQVEDAATALRTALGRAAAADRPRIALALGRLLVMAHRPTEAVAVFRQALNDDPRNVDLLVGLGVALDSSRDFPAAERAYGQALAIDPGNVAARNDLALSDALDGRTNAAAASLRSLRSRVAEAGGSTGNLATIDGNLALIYALQGNMSAAAQAGAGAAPDAAGLAGNMRFYSVLGPAGSGAGDSSGLPPTTGAD